MKKKTVCGILLGEMILLLAGIIIVIVTYFDSLKTVFSAGVSEKQVLSSLVIYFGLAALLAVWIVLLVLFCKIQKNQNTFDSGRIDSLTGLGTKKRIRSSYESATVEYQKYTCLTYLAYDVKRVVARYGEEWGKKTQKGIAKILSTACGDYDGAARIDEGVFVLSSCCRDGLQAQQLIGEVTKKINQYLYRELLETVIPVHAGIYLPERNPVNFETALANAKVGYRHAVDSQSDFFICTREILIAESSRDRLREKLSAAINNQQFDMYLQLVLDTEKNRFVGAEVLSRWNNPEEGLVMPAYYINDMRSTGIIERFDMYMLEKTCKLLSDWASTEFSDLILSCNITRITISSVDFLDRFRAVLKKYDFDRSHLIFEITEDALFDNEAVAYRNISECKNIGIHIAIDDFGMGHSSLSDLSDYPVDQIKLDRQIILKSTTQRGGELLHGLINLAHDLNIKVVCEGVETQKQLEIARGNGCDYIQGYYYSYVYPVSEAQEHYRKSLLETHA